MGHAMGHVLRKSPLQKALLARFGTLIILCAGCLSFLILHRAFGGARQPSGELDIFPRKIWQSWKVDSLRFEARDAERAMTWTLKNPAYRYEVLTDANAETYGTRLHQCNVAIHTLILCPSRAAFRTSRVRSARHRLNIQKPDSENHSSGSLAVLDHVRGGRSLGR
jgi:hypothetical protein